MPDPTQVHWSTTRRDFIDRNVAIVADRDAGLKYREIAEKYGITRQRAWDIYRTYKREGGEFA